MIQLPRRDFLKTGAGAALAQNLFRGHLLVTVDCTKDFPPDRYFSNGPTRVVASAAGRYREAAPKPAARFGYRFPIEHTGKPHLMVIRYPDDKRRYMCVMDGTCYDLSTGVFTGFAQPTSGKMLEIRQVFWPRWTDCSITFMTWGNGEPAAVASFEVHELEDLPALRVAGDPGDGSRRELGIQYEDPCGTAASEGALSHEEWLDRVIAYSRHTGQKLLIYPINWYHGPLFPSEREPADGFDVVVARDRKQYSRWTTHPQDWYARMLERFEKEGLEYQASLTLLRLGSLMRKMNIDEEAIKAGAPTINNVLWNNHVQSSTQDWTPTYNARNYPKLIEYYEQGKSQHDFPWVYGEKRSPHAHPGPMFNPLHPVVQDAVVGLAGEIAARYARHRSFKGLAFNMWHATILWYGSIHSGYDDYTLGLFEKETGITVPVDHKVPDRFSKRYEFLTYKCRPAWIAWRCHKIRQLCRRIRNAVTSARPDLRVTFTLWTETTVPLLLGTVGASHQLYARPGTAEMFREGGFDPALYRNEPGIEVDLHLEPQRDRGGWGTLGADTPLDQATMFRDHDFLDRKTLDEMRAMRLPGAFIFNGWVEAWGKHRWFHSDAGDAQARELAVMDGKPAEGIFRINSEYPPDGFWWNSQLRITHAFPAGVHFLEHYAHAVAEFDACRITRGGLFLDKAHGEEIRRFALAYRMLPREKFETVGASTDPVAVRALARDARYYFYLVNREYYPITVRLAGDGVPGEITLGPYELRSFAMDPGVRVTGFTLHPPEEIVSSLVADGRGALGDIDDCRAAGHFIPGMDEMRLGIESAIVEGRLAWLRRALGGYIVRKCRAQLGRA